MCSICQGRSKTYDFLRLQKKVRLVKLYFYTKNEFYQGMQAFLVELKCLAVVQMSCKRLDKCYQKNDHYSHKLPTLKI